MSTHYKQPFTQRQAYELSPSIIIDEIGRVQNSLARLKETQSLLHSYLEGIDPDEVDDGEASQAIDENKTVIAAQEERIGMLHLALAKHGISNAAHYDRTPREQKLDGRGNSSASSSEPVEPSSYTGDEEGITL